MHKLDTFRIDAPSVMR